MPMSVIHLIHVAHHRAMEAKQEIFKAQDAVSSATSIALENDHLSRRAWWERRQQQNLLRKIERRLARVRAQLEALDTDIRDAMQIDAPLGTSQGGTHAT
jgi:phosphopantetheine adenylyltransferase